MAAAEPFVNVTLRPPLYGVLSPGTTSAVHINPPIATTERLLCVSSRPSETGFTIVKPDTVVVENRARMPIVYGFLVIPNNVIGPTDTLWQLVSAKIQSLLQRLKGGS